LGISVSYHEPEFTMLGWDYLPDTDSFESFFAEASFLPQRLVQIVDFEMSAADWGLAGGFLWRIGERWSLAGFYREGPESEFRVDLIAGPAHPDYPPNFRIVDDFPLPWDFPDVFGLGAAFRSRDGRWTAAFEWDRVEYSVLLDNFLPEQRDAGSALDDADELHLGGEYAFFVRTSVVGVRLGVWHDPDHQFRADAAPEDDPFIRAISPGGDDEIHVSAGVGVAFRSLQVDIGVDLSERRDTASLSAIYSF
jgi:hypothetical protein